MRHRKLAVLAWVLLASVAGAAEQVDPVVAVHEKFLKEAKFNTDDASLLAIMRARTLSAKDREAVANLVGLLGDRKFSVREQAEKDLIKAGKIAVPPLKAALNHPDIEVQRRASRCLDSIEAGTDISIVLSTLTLLAARTPNETLETLLAYLPSAAEDVIIEMVHNVILKIGLKEGKVDAALIKALEAREISQRVAAAYVIARSTPAQRVWLKPLLKATEPELRYHAASGLLRDGNKDAVQALLLLLTDSSLSLGAAAEDLLCRVAGAGSPSVPLGQTAEQRKVCQEAWATWWKDSSDKIDWKTVNVETAILGLTLICESQMKNGQGRIFECGVDGKVRWQVEFKGPLDLQLLSGERMLVADYSGGRVVEVDRTGKVLWESPKVDSPVCAQRLANGNTFIGTYNRVLEVTRDGKTVYSRERIHGSSMYYATKQRNGNTLCCFGSGEIIELDTNGKEIYRLNVGGFSKWAGVEVLANGNFLVARAGADEVAEVDRANKVLWRVKVKNPNSATRLSNGHTLVCSHDDQTVYEFDQQGREVWKQKMDGRPFRAVRR